MATREHTVSTEDPGAFTADTSTASLNSEHSETIAIYPA